ncbi:hypothetical protein OUZ56_024403 [Daphnia magna]|uniref:Uncharacterized protein n=1 Tax=Daphnia magna TaxID=35525 RepID=A0ABR0B0S1_9CRUS|nr:hypothetical protein OUZ56_024403 [Daphnia magna]
MMMVNCLGAIIKFPDNIHSKTAKDGQGRGLLSKPKPTASNTSHMLKLARNFVSKTEKGIMIPGFSHPAK